MLKIPRKQVLDRWDSLTDNSREALCSEQNANILWAASEKEHIPKEKIYTIATLAGDVILGFSHSYDLAQEIRQELGLNPAITESIAQEIDRKIFTPIRTDLEKVYAPAIEETEEVLDLRGRISEIEPMAETKMPELIITETPPAGGGTDKSSFAKATADRHGLESGLTQIAEQPKIIPTEEKKEEKEGPLIIHKEVELKPFGESKKSLGGFFGFLRKDKGMEAKPSSVKAEVQMGLNGKPSEHNIATSDIARLKPGTELIIKSNTEPIKPRPTSPASELAGGRARVVHYSEFLTPISPFPQDVDADKRGLETRLPAVRQGLTRLTEKAAQPPENLPVISRVEPPVMNKVEPIGSSAAAKIEPAAVNKFEPAIMNEIKPPLARPIEPLRVDVFKPPIVNPVKPFMTSGINSPAPVEIKPPAVNRVEPPIINKTEPRMISRIEPVAASRVEPKIVKIPEIKVEEKSSSPSRLGFFDFLKMKFRKSSKPINKKQSISQPSTKPSAVSKIEPPITNRVEPPVASRIEPSKPDLTKSGDDIIDLSIFK